MGNEIQSAPEVTLLKSELEAAAARVAERAMNSTVDGLGEFVGDIFGGLVGDGVKQWRTRRLIAGLAKTKNYLDELGISIENAKPLPRGELFSIFEGVSKQEDVNLTDMWAALLANAMNPKKETYIDPSFSRMLNNMSGLDAIIVRYLGAYEKRISEANSDLRDVYQQNSHITEMEPKEWKEKSDAIQKITMRFGAWSQANYEELFSGFSDENVSFSISNLLRLGLITSPERKSPRKLINIHTPRHLGSRSEELIVDDSPLQNYLAEMRDQAGLAIERKSKLQTLAKTGQFTTDTTTPLYKLTGYGERFLAACSVGDV
ncbi:Abi-alpha family protein [Brucella intermedia]|uniref:Abi-alpha family protein n=1 Tax=Brucella intermedia TaxID=94625 RepID=UPI00124D48CF|nr:Abi-alpha family protein [Brucella intermedia]KAB2723389.1 DUF4393 domain-containing protein [Brucella intermedia]